MPYSVSIPCPALASVALWSVVIDSQCLVNSKIQYMFQGSLTLFKSPVHYLDSSATAPQLFKGPFSTIQNTTDSCLLPLGKQVSLNGFVCCWFFTLRSCPLNGTVTLFLKSLKNLYQNEANKEGFLK